MSRETVALFASESWAIRDGLSTVRIFRRNDVTARESSRELAPALVCWKLETWLRDSPHTLRSLYEALGGRWPSGLTSLESPAHGQRMVRRLAEAFESGMLFAVLEERPVGPGAVAESSPEVSHEDWAPPPALVKPAPVAAPEMDVAAQVQALRDAARDGVPFCEECEKLRKQRAAA